MIAFVREDVGSSYEIVVRDSFGMLCISRDVQISPAYFSSYVESRLMCCLKYENDDYEVAKEGMPDIGEIAVTPEGKGKVVGLNVLERIIQVYLSEQERTVEYTLDELLKGEKNLI